MTKIYMEDISSLDRSGATVLDFSFCFNQDSKKSWILSEDHEEEEV